MWTKEYSAETTASRQAIWRAWADVSRWPVWNPDIAAIELEGPFAEGSRITMTPIGSDAVELVIAGTDIKMTSQVIRALERKGLVRRAVDPVDSRARRLAVTAAGAALAPRAIAAVESADTAFFSGVEPRRLLSVLGALADFGSGRV